MNGWLLDTNIISELGRARPSERVTQWFSGLPLRRTYLSMLVVAELDQGVEALAPDDPRRARHQLYRDRVEADFRGRVLSVTDEVVRLWGALRGRRLLAGLGPAAAIDAMLAATAVHHRLYLATRNVAHVRGLGAIVFNPWTDDPDLLPLTR